MGSLLARAYKRILSGKLAQDAGEHWVTVNAGSKEGGEGGGSHVLLDGEGRVVAGMGGKFKGQNIDRIERKKFINQNAWNRQRKALTEKAGDDTQLKRVVTAGMRSQAEKEADKSNDKWQKEGLYNALTRKTQRENKGMINVLHDYVDQMNAQPKTPNPIAEKIQKQSDGVKQIVTEAVTKYDDLEAVNQLHNIPDGVNVVTEKGQFFKTGDLWSSPDGKKTLEHDQMLRQLKKELKGQISNKDMDNLITNEFEKVQYKDVAERVKDIDPQLAKEIEKTEKKYNKLKAKNIAKAERSEYKRKRGGGHAVSFEEQNTEKKLQELKAQAEAKIAEGKQEAPKAENKGGNALLDSAGRRDQHEAAYKERAKIVKELRKLNVSNPGEDLTFSKYGRTFKRIPDLEGNISTNWREVGRKGEPYKPEYTHEQGSFSNEKVQQYKEWHDRREQWIRDAGLDPIKDRPQYFYDKATNTESFRQIYDPNDTWIKYDDNLPEKDYKFFKEAKQRAKDAGLAVKEEQPKLNTKIDHSSVINDIADRVRDQYNQNGRLFDARTELRKQLSNLKDGTYVTYSKDIILRKKGDELLFNSKRFGWTASGTPTDFFFDGNKLKLGIGDTPEEAKSNYKETEVIDEAKGATVRKENAEKEQARKQAEKAEREERSKDFYLNKIDKIKDSMNKGENYSSGLYKSELYKSLLSKANHGNTEEVNRVLNELKKEGIYTDKHRIWGLADVAKQNADYIAERHEKADKTTTTLKGATVNKEVYNGEARTSVKFDKIPNYATRVALKQNGFKWNADAGEWYKSEGENGTAHENIVNTLKDQGFNEQPKNEAPTAQPGQAQPTQQAEGKQYHDTGIENKNGRYEVSFKAFPSYELRTDMKANGFKWDPNAKVWHTTDREKLDQVMSKHFTERT